MINTPLTGSSSHLAVDSTAIAHAVDLLRRGGLVAFPTETVYGLGADACNPLAVRRIFAAKGRPVDHPVIVHIASAAALEHWTTHVPATARVLAQHFWPGPLTLVLTRSQKALNEVTGGQETVGLRCPSHPWARALLAAFATTDVAAGTAAPSANSFGQLSPTSASHVRADLCNRVDLILDGGACDVGVESAIVDCSGATPKLLRPGAITRRQLEAVLGCSLPDAGNNAPRASGRLESHYAPRTPLELVAESQLPTRCAALAHLRLAVLAPLQLLPNLPPQVIQAAIAPASVTQYEHDLYALLHQLDAVGAQRLLVVQPPQEVQWEAVNDRLKRAQSKS